MSKLCQRCNGFLDQLKSETSALDFEDLERLNQYVLPQLEQSLSDIVARARLKVILSQIRCNIAECILNALAEQGFAVQQAQYSNDDERQPFQVVTRNLEGSEVQVCVDSGEQPGGYEIQIDSLETTPRTENELHQRATEMLRSLQAMGLKVGPIREFPNSQTVPFVVQSRQRTKQPFVGSPPYVH